MRKDTMRIALAAVLTGFMVLPLVGCGQKTVKVDQAEETAKVEDTVSAKSSGAQKAGTETAESTKVESSAINEGAGGVESLETPPPGQGGVPELSGQGGLAEAAAVVEGSRTNVGLLPIYFDFDKSIVRPDQVERIGANALFLKGNPEVKVRIEGNCDGRGTNEYNMALGERRAMGAMKYLLNLGIADSRLSTLSYGEERPLNPGNDEAAWAENRRGDFVIVR